MMLEMCHPTLSLMMGKFALSGMMVEVGATALSELMVKNDLEERFGCNLPFLCLPSLFLPLTLL